MTQPAFARLFATAAAALTLATPALAAAQDYRPYDDYAAYDGYRTYSDVCTDRIHDNGAAGAVLGGIAGALLGSNVAHHGGRTGGALIGAAAGAALGSNIARSSTKQSCRPPEYRASYGAGDYAPAPYSGGYYAPARYGDGQWGRYDEGRHRGWYRHHHHDDDDWD